MTQEFFFGNYLAYPRCVKVAVGQEIDLDFNNNPQPVGPKDNEIWYWGEYYDLANAISVLGQEDTTYVGPAILSNEKLGDKYVITFDGPVTKLGVEITEEETEEFYPIFVNVQDIGIECNITGIEIPNSVTSIESSAFGDCTRLTSVTIPNTVTSIGERAFYGCSGLTSVTIPNSVTSIGENAFVGCTSLTSVTIPNSVISIGDGVFQYCSGLTSVTIGNSVTSIGDAVFYSCNGLTSVTCEAIAPAELGDGTFYETNDCPIYVPTNSVDTYKNEWSEYADRIQAIQ